MAEPRSTAAVYATGPMRWVFLALAVTSLLLGILGIFLPVLPTVPFILLAAWAASRSSPRLHAWMEGHPHFGHHLRNWREGGIVPRKAKWTATFFMSCSAVMLFIVLPQLWLPLAVSAGMVAVGLWLWRRPEQK